MTRDQIAAKVQSNLNDYGVFYTLPEIHESIQDGYSELAAYTGCIYKSTVITLEASRTYYGLVNFAPDILAVTALFNPMNRRWLSPISLPQLDAIDERWECMNGTPYAFWPVSLHVMALFPHSTTAGDTLYMFYRAQADVLLGLSQPAIPDALHSVLVDYATCDLLEQAEELSKASLSNASYFKGIKAVRDAIGSFRMPDMNLRLG